MDVSSVERSSMWMPRSEMVTFTCGSFLFLACNATEGEYKRIFTSKLLSFSSFHWRHLRGGNRNQLESFFSISLFTWSFSVAAAPGEGPFAVIYYSHLLAIPKRWKLEELVSRERSTVRRSPLIGSKDTISAHLIPIFGKTGV